MNIILWIVQGLLAAVFLMAGGMKAAQSKAQIKEKAGDALAWTDDFSELQVTGIGILELLAAFGLILPMLTGILPFLTPLAAVGLILTMIGAAFIHIRRADGFQPVMINVVLLALALFVVIGRFNLFG